MKRILFLLVLTTALPALPPPRYLFPEPKSAAWPPPQPQPSEGGGNGDTCTIV